MKTLFLTSFNPFISRNILSTDVFKQLRTRSDLRIVLFVPDYKVDYFKQRFALPNIVIEGIVVERNNRQDVIFSYFGSSLVDSATLAIHKREKLSRDKNYFKFLLSFVLRKIIGKFNFFKKIIRFFDLATINTSALTKYFDQYKPQAVFATDVFNNDDVHFLAAAKKKGVRTIGMIRSWDNVTTKGVFRVKPNKLITHNEIIKGEVIRENDFLSENLFVSGIPQFDRYLQSKRLSREEFFKKIGLDPNKKLIMFSPFGNRFFKLDWQIIEILKELNQQVLVRLTPNDKVPLENLKPDPLIYVDQPGHQFRSDYLRDTELDERDLDWLADSLYYSDVVVACGTSIVLDAAVFDKPSVLIYFDGFEKNLSYIHSARKNMDFDHVRLVLNKKGARMARSKEELLANVRDFLEHPEADQQYRQSVLKEQAWKLDGGAGVRIAQFIFNNL
ncbi:MAG: hypothetical protein G01um10143_136 [Parcubacteria group bacterium Gr01-1014_3]|nr:MAG: hypothetical protein G01um10143_136 [Parcubacteria group bacterium Gr01-1014_3]